MANRVIIGAQWGDEGKGRITDLLAEEADLIIRYQGGSNAGHTVIREGEKFELHLIPSGILYPQKESIISSGVLLDPLLLINEMEGLQKRGINLQGLKISAQAHLVLPYHLLLDRLQEEKEKKSIGTTRRGIGPGYIDKVSRKGVRLFHLYHPKEFQEILSENLSKYQTLLKAYYGYEEPLSFQDIYSEYLACGEKLKGHLVENVPLLIANRLAAGKRILFEGAQGSLLDIDHGTYPFVTSSSSSIGGVFTGCGISPFSIHEIIGVVKAYQTRVGNGPFPTELLDGVGDILREQGKEYGVTTGRPRRCGWLDLPLLRHTVRINGFTSFILTKLDVLSGLKEVKICTAYRVGEDTYQEVLPDPLFLSQVEPIYEKLPGWEEPLSSITDIAALPLAAKNLVEFVEEETRVPISHISVGPQREQIIRRVKT